MTRRDMLRLAGASMAAAAGVGGSSSASAFASAASSASVATSAASLTGQTPQASTSKPLRHMGATPAGFAVRSKTAGFDIIEHTHSLGLGAVQTSLPAPTAEAAAALRAKLERYEMRAILGVRLPREDKDVEAFDAAVKAAREANAYCLHVPMTGRRYEDFDTLAAFQASFARNKKSVALAEPVLRKHRLKLAIENHKGWRAAEQADWLKSVGSEYVGVCFDFGNNISLCEDPAESLRLLAPFTWYCHIKDMAVEPYEDGFLLSEVPLGEGFLDIPGMVRTLQAKDPEMILGLEFIARDPLKIPVFTEKYWVSFTDPSSPLPGVDLARTLMTVKKHPPKAPLPRLTGLTREAQLHLEDACISRSIDFARSHLNL